MNNVEIANEIIRQMCGTGRLTAMTGAKNFVAHDSAVSFRIGRNSKRVNYVKITLTPSDLYTIEYGYIRGMNYTVRTESTEIYNDMLKADFERETGMYLTF